jgi:hypothetical protein
MIAWKRAQTRMSAVHGLEVVERRHSCLRAFAVSV